jgi:hypothetical protein
MDTCARTASSRDRAITRRRGRHRHWHCYRPARPRRHRSNAEIGDQAPIQRHRYPRRTVTPHHRSRHRLPRWSQPSRHTQRLCHRVLSLAATLITQPQVRPRPWCEGCRSFPVPQQAYLSRSISTRERDRIARHVSALVLAVEVCLLAGVLAGCATTPAQSLLVCQFFWLGGDSSSIEHWASGESLAVRKPDRHGHVSAGSATGGTPRRARRTRACRRCRAFGGLLREPIGSALEAADVIHEVCHPLQRPIEPANSLRRGVPFSLPGAGWTCLRPSTTSNWCP